ncbi:nucleotidyl transferase AbiEii/AbiGii toxin family protein [Acidisoma sp. S159]|jgi:hypothetical protein|uniref:nucleotidyl transferase AbiEii/AbiGii toxin family protein n=1 Tax=Acidisoma sp. S159 TaxID=1747225 RepID=UPI00210FFF29|nr:nucleotidyl transferase AbiEii/AbiGii toxin family protein [Acidisoma sp. S159]
MRLSVCFTALPAKCVATSRPLRPQRGDALRDLVDDPFRPTRDLDLLGYGDSEADAITDTFRAICSQPVGDDGVTFDVAALLAVPIYEEAEYGGVRVRTTATIAGARIPNEG